MAPTRAPAITAEKDEYLHVRLNGVFLHDRQTLVWTATDEGSGFWVMTPLRQADGSIVLVNRGFAPVAECGHDRRCAPGPAGEVTVTGLLRMAEPSGFSAAAIRRTTTGTRVTCPRWP